MAISCAETTFNEGDTTILKQADIVIAPKKQISEIQATSMSSCYYPKLEIGQFSDKHEGAFLVAISAYPSTPIFTLKIAFVEDP